MRRFVPLAAALGVLAVPASASANYKAYWEGAHDAGNYLVAHQKVCTDNTTHLHFVWRLDSPGGCVRRWNYYALNPAGCHTWRLRHLDTFASGLYYTRISVSPAHNHTYAISGWHRLYIR